MKRTLFLSATLIVWCAGRAHAEWARSLVAKFPGYGHNPNVVTLDDGPALAVFEGETLHLFRRRDGDWIKSSLPLPAKANRVEACACRGDGVRRLYAGGWKDPRVFEIAPYGKEWELLAFYPNGDPPSRNGAHTDGFASAVSHADGRPSLFIRRLARQQVVECRWKSKDWNCADAVGASGPDTTLHANPPGWPQRDLLVSGSSMYAREGSGWSKILELEGRILLSRAIPLHVYRFGWNSREVRLGPDFDIRSEEPFVKDVYEEVDPDDKTLPPPLPGSRNFLPGRVYGSESSVGMPRGPGIESIFFAAEDYQLHELRKVDGRWTDAAIARFAGGCYQPVAGDARGDGVERVYAMVREVANRIGGRSTELWELTYHAGSRVVRVPDPESPSIEPEGRRLLGELVRAELGRHGHLTVVDERSRAAARAERALTKDDSLPTSASSEAALAVTVLQEGAAFSLSARLSGAGLKERRFDSPPSEREKLPEAALALARRIAEEWPVVPERTP